ncbi:hypothetical protein [Rhodopirellula baltica]|uniref:Uncharacterized protein n=1 Tax=Rhodopirellula baltica WH47 TaxID=991778 RepID=F2ALQ9_RHOBT|nr:hypothetical protein [Rhodopirellula baltica]EGF29405.1 hypothetical protein RBWH47_02769 [Rhodopirellula baltica WH47]
MKNVYGGDVETQMRNLYESLSEKDRRRYAAIEASKLGHGGIGYVAELFGCHPDTITQGRRDLNNLPHDEAQGRVRKKGEAVHLLATASRESSTRLKLKSRRKQLDRRSATVKSGPTSGCQ